MKNPNISNCPTIKYKLMGDIHGSGLLFVIKQEGEKTKCAIVEKTLQKANSLGLISCFYG